MKVFLFFVILFFVLLLQGCVVVVVVGMVVVGIKVVMDLCMVGIQVDDSILELCVNSVLLKDEQIKKQVCINVIVYQGKVLLIGQLLMLDFFVCVK